MKRDAATSVSTSTMKPSTNHGTSGGAHRCWPHPWYRTVLSTATTKSPVPTAAPTIRISKNESTGP